VRALRGDPAHLLVLAGGGGERQRRLALFSMTPQRPLAIAALRYGGPTPNDLPTAISYPLEVGDYHPDPDPEDNNFWNGTVERTVIG